MELGPEETLRGRLLVAAPQLSDPNFDRTVVLVLEHTTEGALGLILNRPSDRALGDVLPAWEDAAAEPGVVFVGGPVSPTSAVCLARAAAPTEAVEGWQPLFGRLGSLDPDPGPDGAEVDVEALRLFAGYTGWGPAQLEGELAEDAWFVADADPGDALGEDPDHLWSAVLRRQGGHLALIATMPPDPSLN